MRGFMRVPRIAVLGRMMFTPRLNDLRRKEEFGAWGTLFLVRDQDHLVYPLSPLKLMKKLRY